MTFDDFRGTDNPDEIAKLAKRLTDEVGTDKLKDIFAGMKQALVQEYSRFLKHNLLS